MRKQKASGSKSTGTHEGVSTKRKSKKRKASLSIDTEDALDILKKKAKSERIWREVVPSEPISDGYHNYQVDPLDHAETDLRAYLHLKPFLLLLANRLHKQQAQLGLWDPYFCKGAMVERLGKLGFKKVHNVNEDCYAVFKSGKLPDHDVVITSPPYSGNHIERCLRFCSANGAKKAWCLLLPNWVQSRPYFQEILGEESSRVFFISPMARYTYWMPLDLVTGKLKPDWVGQDGGTSPYDSTWFIYLPKHMPAKKIYAALERMQDNGKEWALARSLKAARWKVKNTQRGPREKTAVAGTESTVVGLAHSRKKRRKKSRNNAASAKHEKHDKWAGTVAFD